MTVTAVIQGARTIDGPLNSVSPTSKLLTLPRRVTKIRSRIGYDAAPVHLEGRTMMDAFLP